MHPWVQKFYPVPGLGCGERLPWHFQTPVLYWINFGLRPSTLLHRLSDLHTVLRELGLGGSPNEHEPPVRAMWHCFQGNHIDQGGDKKNKTAFPWGTSGSTTKRVAMQGPELLRIPPGQNNPSKIPENKKKLGTH